MLVLWGFFVLGRGQFVCSAIPLPILHPGAGSFPGTGCTCTQPSTWRKRKRDSSDQAIFLHWCSSDAHLAVVVAFGCGHRSVWVSWSVCSYAALYTTNCNVLCVLTPYSRTSINFSAIWATVYIPTQTCIIICIIHVLPKFWPVNWPIRIPIF